MADPEKPVVVVEKSRRMLATTMVCVFVAWNMLTTVTTGSADSEVWSCAIIKQNTKESAQLIRRVKDIIERLPPWLRRPFSVDNELALEIENGGRLFGLHAGGDGPRGEGYVLGLLDEFAFQENARRNYQALTENTWKIVVLSTPNGENNQFHDLTHDKVPGVTKIRLHYSQHPYRVPGSELGEAWMARKKIGKSRAAWNQENEIDYSVWAEKGWFEDAWDEQITLQPDADYEWQPRHLIVTRGWDFGYRRPACVWSFVNDWDQWVMSYELLGQNIDITDFVKLVLEVSDARFPRAMFQDAGDPACTQRKSAAATVQTPNGAVRANTDYAILKAMGVNLKYDRIPGVERRVRHRMTRELMALREDRRFSLLVDSRGCPLITKAFKGGYRRPEKSERNVKALEMEHPNPADDTFVHLIDAGTYPIVQYQRKIALPEFDQGADSFTQDDAEYMRELNAQRRQAAGIV